jgi:hypothetical protein
MIKKTLVFFLISIPILVLFVILLPTGGEKQGRKNFETFYNAEIDSHIESIEVFYKGSRIKLIDGRKFVFYPYTNELP